MPQCSLLDYIEQLPDPRQAKNAATYSVKSFLWYFAVFYAALMIGIVSNFMLERVKTGFVVF